MPYLDRTLICRDCGKNFVWTSGEQRFFSAKGFSHPPSRCKEHRLKHKAQLRGIRALPFRKEYDIICPSCNKPGKVPFDPTTKEALLCADCFLAQRSAKAVPQRVVDLSDQERDNAVG